MKKIIFITIKSFFLIFLFSGCNKDDNKTLPTLTTASISEITDTSAYSGGLITDSGNDEIIERGVCWSSTVLEPIVSGDKTNDGIGDGEFTSLITGLLPGTTYYIRAYATNSIGTAYGNTAFFKTISGLTKVTTSQISLITQNTAQCGGHITSEGNSLITSRGVCWGKNTSPDITGNITIDGTGYGEFISNITDLESNTTYYVRAYATNGDGQTAYGADSVFTTLADLPNLTTAQVSLITQTTAQCGGDITFTGGDSIIARGVCWSTETLPTISDNTTIDGKGSGEFVSDLTNLLASTTYYIRAYATNSQGATAYGDEQTFTTLEIIDISPNGIEYPDTSTYGANILYSPLTTIKANTYYSFAAILPESTDLTIKMSGGLWYYMLVNSSTANWDVTVYDNASKSQIFNSKQSNKKCDLKIYFETGTVTIDYYEKGSVTPIRTKELTIK